MYWLFGKLLFLIQPWREYVSSFLGMSKWTVTGVRKKNPFCFCEVSEWLSIIGCKREIEQERTSWARWANVKSRYAIKSGENWKAFISTNDSKWSPLSFIYTPIHFANLIFPSIHTVFEVKEQNVFSTLLTSQELSWWSVPFPLPSVCTPAERQSALLCIH